MRRIRWGVLALGLLGCGEGNGCGDRNPMGPPDDDPDGDEGGDDSGNDPDEAGACGTIAPPEDDPHLIHDLRFDPLGPTGIERTSINPVTRATKLSTLSAVGWPIEIMAGGPADTHFGLGIHALSPHDQFLVDASGEGTSPGAVPDALRWYDGSGYNFLERRSGDVFVDRGGTDYHVVVDDDPPRIFVGPVSGGTSFEFTYYEDRPGFGVVEDAAAAASYRLTHIQSMREPDVWTSLRYERDDEGDIDEVFENDVRRFKLYWKKDGDAKFLAGVWNDDLRIASVLHYEWDDYSRYAGQSQSARGNEPYRFTGISTPFPGSHQGVAWQTFDGGTQPSRAIGVGTLPRDAFPEDIAVPDDIAAYPVHIDEKTPQPSYFSAGVVYGDGPDNRVKILATGTREAVRYACEGSTWKEQGGTVGGATPIASQDASAFTAGPLERSITFEDGRAVTISSTASRFVEKLDWDTSTMDELVMPRLRESRLRDGGEDRISQVFGYDDADHPMAATRVESIDADVQPAQTSITELVYDDTGRAVTGFTKVNGVLVSGWHVEEEGPPFARRTKWTAALKVSDPACAATDVAIDVSASGCWIETRHYDYAQTNGAWTVTVSQKGSGGSQRTQLAKIVTTTQSTTTLPSPPPPLGDDSTTRISGPPECVSSETVTGVVESCANLKGQPTSTTNELGVEWFAEYNPDNGKLLQTGVGSATQLEATDWYASRGARSLRLGSGPAGDPLKHTTRHDETGRVDKGGWSMALGSTSNEVETSRSGDFRHGVRGPSLPLAIETNGQLIRPAKLR
jgi:hypothetical protein